MNPSPLNPEIIVAEIIAIGSELLTPDRLDTNSLWLTEQLNSLGTEVRMKTVVGDDDARVEAAIGEAVRRSRVVITTGGLGPTEDDVTRKVAARALGRRIMLDEAVLEQIKAKFLRMQRPMAEINARQAMIIEEAEVLDNPNGTAPGMYIEHGGCTLVLLPGPPREMRPMFENEVRSRLATKSGNLAIVRRILRVAGMGESAVDELIAPVYTQYENPRTTILFNSTEIEIHLTAQACTEKEAGLLLDGLAGQIEERLGNSIFAFRGETMEEVVSGRLAVNGFTLAVAESCTGGLIAQRLTELSGASGFFLEGVVTYSNESKMRLLGIDPEMLKEHGAVSAQVAEAMAQGVRLRASADFGLAVTGIAGPGGATPEKPVGLVYVSLADDVQTEHRKLLLPGDRHLVRSRASQAALDLLRRRLV